MTHIQHINSYSLRQEAVSFVHSLSMCSTIMTVTHFNHHWTHAMSYLSQ